MIGHKYDKGDFRDMLDAFIKHPTTILHLNTVDLAVPMASYSARCLLFLAKTLSADEWKDMIEALHEAYTAHKQGLNAQGTARTILTVVDELVSRLELPEENLDQFVELLLDDMLFWLHFNNRVTLASSLLKMATPEVDFHQLNEQVM